MKLTIVIFLGLAAAAMAQPWQWEQYQGDYFHPTGFPEPTWSPICSGDFDGDGDDEYVSISGGHFDVTVQDNGVFHWTVHSSVGESVSAEWAFAINLDADAQDELLAFGDPPHVYKAVAFDPWTWVVRDSLLTGLDFPDWPGQGIFGDFDGDGLLNGFFMTGDWGATFELTERTSAGVWATDTIFDVQDGVSSGIFSGDFDHDGDTDIAIAPLLTDVPPYCGFIENLSPGMVWHVGLDCGSVAVTAGPTGGDLDGDGLWEGLYRYEGYSGYTLVETQDDPESFVSVASQQYIGSLPGPVFGNFRAGGQTVVGAIRNWTYGPPFYTNQAFACMSRSDSGWQPLNNRFSIWWDYNCIGGNLADLNGDGLPDIFAALANYDPGTVYRWTIWENVGTTDEDSFRYHWQEMDYFTRRFLANPDTAFGHPQIGDITGDGRAELAVVAVPPDSQRKVLFFEMIGNIEDTTFVLHPEWSASLPTGWDRIRLADIDNDGLAELCAREQSGSWRTYFRRNGDWVEYTGILPPVTTPYISFADADNDSDLDLFTDTDLWYSLSPDAVESRPEAVPRDFALSAYPNPFNNELRLAYELPQNADLALKVFDLLGREVALLAQGHMSAGRHELAWSAEGIASGVYFVRLETGKQTQTAKVLYVR